ncbi:MAG: TrbI/VirB10 family protein [Rickettsiaceae bacterium]|nr:TrbI/VirB10 family protein [Rickettsiaceae bacterium]
MKSAQNNQPETKTKPQPEVEQELSQVATNPKQNALILVGIVLLFGYLFFNFFVNSNKDTNKKDENITPPTRVVSPTQNVDIDIPSIPTLPTPPKLADLEPPLPNSKNNTTDTQPPALPTDDNIASLPLDPSLPTPSLPTVKIQDDQALKREEKKRKSSMILIAGTPPQKTAAQIQEEADFNYRGDLNLMLGRGKIIDAVVESALSSDFGGEIRAVITKDVYSEWGKNILIPKGSRVFGNYNTTIDQMYGRINVLWLRIDLVNGYSINLNNSMTVDNLGRTGQAGRLDQKFQERLTNAVLRSAFNIALANTLDKVVKPQIQSNIASTRNLDAANIKNIANSIFTQTGISDGAKREQICASTLNAFSDKTSSSFLQLQSTCERLRTDPTSDDTAKLLSLMNSINSISDSLIRDTNTNVQETQAQSASKESYKDISDTLKSFVEEQNFKPTVTIDQGTVIKIYVNRDYKFPKKAVSNRRFR